MFERDKITLSPGGKVYCHYCRDELKLRSRTLDHVVPKSKGGSSGPDNLVSCCQRCNKAKGNMDYSQFLGICHSIGIALVNDRLLELARHQSKSV